MRLGALWGDGAIDGVVVSVQRANSTYPAGLRDQAIGDSLEDLAGMRVPHTLENIQWQQTCAFCNMQEDFSKWDHDASGIAQVVTQAIVGHLRSRGVLAEYMKLAKVASVQERGALRTVLFQRQTAATANLGPVQYQGGLRQPPTVEWDLTSPSERKWLQQILKGGPIVFDFGREPVQFGHLLKHMPRKDTGDEHTDFGWELLRNMTWYVNVQLKDSRNALAAFDWRDTVLTQSDLANPRPRAPTRLWNQSGRIDKVSIVESMLLVPTLFEAIDTKIKNSHTADQHALGGTSSRLLRAAGSIGITHADVAEGLSIHGGQCTICVGFMRIGILENEDSAHTGRIDVAALSINRTMEFFPEFEETSEFHELHGARALHTALNCLGNVCCTGCNFLEGSASLRRGGGKLANLLAKEVLAAMAKVGAREEYLRRVERDRDRHRLRQLEAGGGARDADLDTIQKLEGLVTKSHISALNSAYSTKDAHHIIVLL
jgi:hypothetical protein